jgi:hypothetical protein
MRKETWQKGCGQAVKKSLQFNLINGQCDVAFLHETKRVILFHFLSQKAALSCAGNSIDFNHLPVTGSRKLDELAMPGPGWPVSILL